MILIFVGILHASMYVAHAYLVPEKPEEGVGCLVTRVADECVTLWVLAVEPGSSKSPSALNAEPPLQPLVPVFKVSLHFCVLPLYCLDWDCT